MRTTVGVRISSEALDRVDQIAEVTGTDRSSVLRLALSKGLPLAEQELKGMNK